MSMADIIMKGSAMAISARSRGIESLGDSLLKMGDIAARREERKEDQDIAKEKWGTQKRFMNAQAARQEQIVSSETDRVDSEVTFTENSSHIAKNGMDEAAGYQYHLDHGTAAQAESWRTNQHNMQAEKTAQISTAYLNNSKKATILKNNFASVENEEGYINALNKTNMQISQIEGKEINIEEGLGENWQDNLKVHMGNTKTIKEALDSIKASQEREWKGSLGASLNNLNKALKMNENNPMRQIAIDSALVAINTQNKKAVATSGVAENGMLLQDEEMDQTTRVWAEKEARAALGLEIDSEAPMGYQKVVKYLYDLKEEGVNSVDIDIAKQSISLDDGGSTLGGLLSFGVPFDEDDTIRKWWDKNGGFLFKIPEAKISEGAPVAYDRPYVAPESGKGELVAPRKSDVPQMPDEYEYKMVGGKKMRRKKAQ